MRIDVALATYNGATYLAEFLDSIRAQDHPDVGLVVSDDGSTDTTLDIIAERFSEARVSANRSDKGIIGNFSTALAMSTAEHVALADQDDVWLPSKLTRLSTRLSEIEHGKLGPALVFSDLQVVDQGLHVINPSFFAVGCKSLRAQRLQDFLVSNHIPGCSMMMNRQLLDLALPIPTNVMMHDWWLALVAATFGVIERLDDPLVLYRQHGHNTLGAPVAAANSAKWVSRLSAPLQRIAHYRDQAAVTRETLTTFRDRFSDIMPAKARKAFDVFLEGGPVSRVMEVRGAHTGEHPVKAFFQIVLM